MRIKGTGKYSQSEKSYAERLRIREYAPCTKHDTPPASFGFTTVSRSTEVVLTSSAGNERALALAPLSRFSSLGLDRKHRSRHVSSWNATVIE